MSEWMNEWMKEMKKTIKQLLQKKAREKMSQTTLTNNETELFPVSYTKLYVDLNSKLPAWSFILEVGRCIEVIKLQNLLLR